MISLLVNDEEVELLEGQNVSLQKQVYDLLKKEQVTKSYSTNIKIPLTGKNIKIFEGLFSPLQQTITIAYKKIPARLQIDNIFIGDIGSYLIVQSLTEKYLNVVYYERQVMSYISQIPDDTLENILPATTWTTINNAFINTTPFTNTNSNTTGVKYYYEKARNNNIEEIVPIVHTNLLLVSFANIDTSKYFNLIRPFVLSTFSRYVTPTKIATRPKLTALTYSNLMNRKGVLQVRFNNVRESNYTNFSNTVTLPSITHSKSKRNVISVLKITRLQNIAFNNYEVQSNNISNYTLYTEMLIENKTVSVINENNYFIIYSQNTSDQFNITVRTTISDILLTAPFTTTNINQNINYDFNFETSEIDMDFDAKYLFGDINLRTLVKDLLAVENSTMIFDNGEYKLTPFTDILKVATTQLEDTKVVKTIFKSSNLGKKMYLEYNDGQKYQIHTITGNEIIEDEKTLGKLRFDGTEENYLFDDDGKYKGKYYYVPYRYIL